MFFVVFFLVFPPVTVFAQGAKTYYVSTSGSDSNPGSQTQPWKTIQNAVDSINPGDTIFVRAGTYNESVKVTKRAAIDASIKLANYTGETVTLDGGTNRALYFYAGNPQYWIVEGLRFLSTNSTATVEFDSWGCNGTCFGINYITLRNNYISGPLKIYGAYNLIESNEVDGRVNNGNGVMDLYDVSHHNTFRNNNVHNFSIRGIWSMHRTHDSLFENNYVHDCGDQCINTDGYGSVEWRHVIRSNLLENCGTGIELENNFDSIAENNTIRNSSHVGIDSINYGRNMPPADYPDTPWPQGKRCEVGGENNQYGDLDGDNDCEGNITNNIIRQNLITNTSGGGGIILYFAGGVKILGNTLYNNGNHGSLFFNCKKNDVLYCPQTEIKNNIFANSTASTEILLDDLSLISVDNNNLFYHPTSQKVYEINGVWTSYTVDQYKATTGKGVGSLYGNPLFVDTASNNFHLQALSPAIDSGIDIGLAKDLDNKTRPFGSAYDIGAYEFAGTLTTPTPTYLISDINNDSYVNSADVLLLLTSWATGGSSTYSQREDINKDGKVNSLDFGRVMKDWGK